MRLVRECVSNVIVVAIPAGAEKSSDNFDLTRVATLD